MCIQKRIAEDVKNLIETLWRLSVSNFQYCIQDKPLMKIKCNNVHYGFYYPASSLRIKF